MTNKPPINIKIHDHLPLQLNCLQNLQKKQQNKPTGSENMCPLNGILSFMAIRSCQSYI